MNFRDERNLIGRINKVVLPEPQKHFDNEVVVEALLHFIDPFFENRIETEKLVYKDFDIFIAVVQKLSEAVGKADNRTAAFSDFWDKLPGFMQKSDKVSNCLEAWEREPYDDIVPLPKPYIPNKSRRFLGDRYILQEAVV